MAQQIDVVDPSAEHLHYLCRMPPLFPLLCAAAALLAQNIAFDLTVFEIVHEEHLTIQSRDMLSYLIASCLHDLLLQERMLFLILSVSTIKTKQCLSILYSRRSFFSVVCQIQIFDFNQLLPQVLLVNLQPFDAFLIAYSSNLIECDFQLVHCLVAHEFLALFKCAAVFANQLVVILIGYFIH